MSNHETIKTLITIDPSYELRGMSQAIDYMRGDTTNAITTLVPTSSTQTTLVPKSKKKINIKYNAKHAKIILSGLEDGNTLQDILKTHSILPPRRIIQAWRIENPKFDKQYRTCVQLRCEKWVDEIRELSQIDYDHIDGLQDRKFELAKNKIRMDTLRFLCTQATALLAKDVHIDNSVRVQDRAASSQPQINILNYSQSSDQNEPKLAISQHDNTVLIENCVKTELDSIISFDDDTASDLLEQ
jgi:hypothetical protein